MQHALEQRAIRVKMDQQILWDLVRAQPTSHYVTLVIQSMDVLTVPMGLLELTAVIVILKLGSLVVKRALVQLVVPVLTVHLIQQLVIVQVTLLTVIPVIP